MKASIAMLALLVALPAANALAADYPIRPIRIVVGLAAGGPADVAARALAEPLSRALGQPVVIEDKPGAGGAIAGETVRNSAPDGYTLLWGQSGLLVGVPLTRKQPPYDPLMDFTPLSLVGRLGTVLVTHPSVPAKTLSQFVDYARANPGKVSYATNVLTEDIMAARLSKAAGVDMVRVPYKGGMSGIPDLLAGRVQLGFMAGALGLEHVAQARLRALAILLPERIAAAPDVPTIAEAGFAEATATSWFGLFGPAKLPKEIVERLSHEINLALELPELRAQLDRSVVQPAGSTPQGLATLVQQDLESWRRVVRETGIAIE